MRLKECIGKFVADVNGNDRVRKLVTGWNPSIVISPTDTDATLTIEVRDGEARMLEERQESRHLIEVQAKEDVLLNVFSGNSNPAAEVLDGNLHVFGTEKDQVKLDAITLVLWGF